MTFAGSPDRVEAQLVPEAGYELDTFRVTRLPAAAVAGARCARSSAPARRRARAARSCARSRPDVVLGGGGYVAGPMVLAAATMRIPAALTEADAHLGLANRLALPFAKRVFLAYPLEGRGGAKYRVVGRPIPARARAMPQSEARAALRAAARRARCCSSTARSRALGRSTSSRSRHSASPARRSSTSPASATTSRCGARVKRDDYKLLPYDRSLRRGALGRRPRRGARGSTRLGAGRGGEARDPRPVSVRDRRPPGEERRALRAGGRRGHGARARARRRPGPRPLAARRPGAPERMGEAMLRAARPDAADDDRRGADRGLQPLAGRRLWFVGIGGAGLSRLRAARARLGRRGRRLGPRRDAVPRRARRDGDPHLGRAGGAGRLGGRRLVRVPGFPGKPRGELLAELVALPPLDRRRRHARQRDDGRDDRVRAAGDRARSGVADRRAGARSSAATRARGRAGSSSRATSRTGGRSAAGEIAVVTNLELDHHTEFAPRPSSRRSSSAGSRGSSTSSATRRRPTSSSRAGGAQPVERGRGAGRARARRRAARGGRARAARVHAVRCDASRCASWGR